MKVSLLLAGVAAVSLQVPAFAQDAPPPPPEDAPTPAPAEESAAAEQAALGWQFEPAFRCQVESRDAAGRPNCAPRSETPQAVSLSYRFVFEQRAGRGTVRVDE